MALSVSMDHGYQHVRWRWYQLKTLQDIFVPEGLRARIRGKDRIWMKRENGKGTRERAEKQEGSWEGKFS